MKTRGVAQNSALALAGDLAGKAGIVAAMMVAARGLSTGEFAVLATATAAATVLTAALDIGSQTLLTRDGVAGPPARGALCWALAKARLPLLAAALTGAVGFGLLAGRPLAALAVLGLALAGAVQLTLTGTLRSAQDLRPEALAKLIGGVLTLAAAVICVTVAPRASALLLALAVASVLALVPMLRAARHAVRTGPPVRAWIALRRAAPLGAMALATLAYYRSGTIGLSILSSSAQTARFAAASTIGWGLLCVGNAVTTGLLPRLAAAADQADRIAVARRALAWTTLICALIGAFVALLAGPLLTVVFGSRFAPAAPSLRLLALATILIAPAGVLGIALVSVGRLRAVGFQVAASLTVNLVVLAALAPVLGATGAAVATLACEAVALSILVGGVRSAMPGLLQISLRRAPVRRAALPAKALR
jgi:O-antigen/teichoic acid export membrane protein